MEIMLRLYPSENAAANLCVQYDSENHRYRHSYYPDSTSATFVGSAAAASINGLSEDPRTEALRKLSYGIVLPLICTLGIIGNVLNLIVLTRKNMRGTAYIYMRGYSAAALLAILLAIPFGIRMIVYKDTGRSRNFAQAFYSAHLELFLGNACLGICVMMLLVLTIERYVSVCHPGFVRPVMGPPRITVVLIPLVTVIIYLPSVFRHEVIKCHIESVEEVVYHKKDNDEFLSSLFYSVYKVILEVIFKFVPTVLIAGLNLRIMIVYRKTCERRRRMTLTRNCLKDEDPRKFAEERRLILLLGSTSILFLVSVSPMAILHMTLSQENLSSFSYQVFRAMANILELANYSITFYIYCLFSEDFRNTLLRTLNWPWFGSPICHRDTEFQMNTHSLSQLKKIPLKSSTNHINHHHIQHTTTSGLCPVGRSSSI